MKNYFDDRIVTSVQSLKMSSNKGSLREPSQITFALRGTYMVSKMLTYVYIGSVGPFENVYVNKKKVVNFSLFRSSSI